MALSNTMNLEGPSLFFDTALALPRDIAPIHISKEDLKQFVKAHMQDYPKMIEGEQKQIKSFLNPLYTYMEKSTLQRKFLNQY